MSGCKRIVFLIVLAFLDVTRGFNTLVPEGKEVVYHYRAHVKAGTLQPAIFASQFVLQGKLHVQSNSNATLARLSDLKYKLYNGKLDHIHEHDAQEAPLPQEVQDLQQSFRIVHDSHGKASGIATGGQEKEWSRNIKRAIGSILQLDVDHILKQHERPNAFVTREHSIYGYGEVNYNILPRENDEIEVHKSHHMITSRHLYQHHVSNLEPFYCDLASEEPIGHDSHRRYHIVKHEGHRIVKFIEAVGGIFYTPFQAKSDEQHLLVNQSFEMMSVQPLSQKMEVKSPEHFEDNLSYHFFDERDLKIERILDVTNGRSLVDYSKLILKVHEILEDITKYLQGDHIHTRIPDIKHGQSINRIQRLLTHFDVQHLEQIRNELKQGTTQHHTELLNIFHHLLPMVGTRASALLIKKLIMEKQVSDEVAVHLLQDLPLNLMVPHKDLVSELEDFMHMGDKFNWNVRKTALLSFATLVHKSYQQHTKSRHNRQDQMVPHDYLEPHPDDQSLDQHFEKYVTEYINKIRESQDYKIQMVYMIALRNMKLDSIARHMKPALMGEWGHSNHLRFLTLEAVGVVAAKSADLSFEMFWPIFTNRDEHTEMRIAAYFFIMESGPTPSRLSNVYWHMMNEPNEELYRFHYTYVKSIVDSREPCKHDQRMKMAQIFRYMHPPTHGLSTAHLEDFKDHMFGYSGGLHGYYINSNDSHVLTVMLTHQIFHQYHADHVMYIKVHGLNHRLNANEMHNSGKSNIMFNLAGGLPTDQHFHVEVALSKNDHVYSVLYIDNKNMEDFEHLLNFLNKDDKQTHTRQYLQINFARFQKVLIPTDLGTPALWEFLIPTVNKDQVDITKEVANKVVNVQVDNNYMNWIHFRHGLSFYNPFVDVWQGINRYQSYDSVLPLHWSITLNPQQQSLKLSWNKHSDARKDVVGLRSHVLTMTFVKDDYGKNLLSKSSPQSKEFAVASHGEDFRNDYTIYHDDDLNTGHKWQVMAYDSTRRVSNGSMRHIIQSIMQHDHSKHMKSPLCHFSSILSHLLTSTALLPHKDIHGFMIRGEPSSEHTVSNIDISIRLNLESVKDHFAFIHATKMSTRLTYSVKNREQSLKTWDMNAILDMNSGHTLNNLKLHLSRLIPGQKEYKICAEGVKKWTQQGITGHMNIAMDQTTDGKCSKDGTVIDVTMTGKRSHEQDHEHHVYGECDYVLPYSIENLHTLECLAAHSSIRDYVYNVKSTNVPSEFKYYLWHMWDLLKGTYTSYYTFQDEHEDEMGDNNLRVEVMYPMQDDEVDLHLTTPNHKYHLTGMPSSDFKMYGAVPDTTTYSKWFMAMHSLGLVDHCRVYWDHYRFNQNKDVHQTVPNDWVLYLADKSTNPQHAVYVLPIGVNQISLKVVNENHVLEFVPQSGEILIDGHIVRNQDQHEDWMSFHMFQKEVHQPVAIMLHHFGVHLEYDGRQVVIVTPKFDHEPWHGKCFDGQ